MRAASNAFRRSGRASVTRRTCPSRSTLSAPLAAHHMVSNVPAKRSPWTSSACRRPRRCSACRSTSRRRSAARAARQVTIRGHTWRTTPGVYDGVGHIVVNRAVKAATGVDAGIGSRAMELDTEPDGRSGDLARLAATRQEGVRLAVVHPRASTSSGSRRRAPERGRRSRRPERVREGAPLMTPLSGALAASVTPLREHGRGSTRTPSARSSTSSCRRGSTGSSRWGLQARGSCSTSRSAAASPTSSSRPRTTACRSPSTAARRRPPTPSRSPLTPPRSAPTRSSSSARPTSSSTSRRSTATFAAAARLRAAAVLRLRVRRYDRVRDRAGGARAAARRRSEPRRPQGLGHALRRVLAVPASRLRHLRRAGGADRRRDGARRARRRVGARVGASREVAAVVREPAPRARRLGELRAFVERFPRQAALKRLLARCRGPVREDVARRSAPSPPRGATNSTRGHASRCGRPS